MTIEYIDKRLSVMTINLQPEKQGNSKFLYK